MNAAARVGDRDVVAGCGDLIRGGRGREGRGADWREAVEFLSSLGVGAGGRDDLIGAWVDLGDTARWPGAAEAKGSALLLLCHTPPLARPLWWPSSPNAFSRR
jgi:hypothetical protein